MKPERWQVNSLRRFRNHEVLIYVYLGIGGLCSMIYFVGACMKTQIYTLLLNMPALTQHATIFGVFGQIVVNSILRVVFWLPQLFWQVFMGGEGFIDWLVATNIL
nr:hypothetical protein [Alphaproteobacteria bacterium]